jgi:anti-anti-sigma factor
MIRAHRDPLALTLAVAGPATMTESPAVQQSASEEVSRGMRAVRVDLRDCTAIDSTFSGTLLALKRKLDAVGGSLTLVSPSPKVREQLDQMGLDDFYAVDIAAPAEGAWREVPCTPGTLEALRRLVIDAHEQLARVPGPAGRAFHGVVDELRRPEPEPRRSDPELPSSHDA